jgi:hypothetical protein
MNRPQRKLILISFLALLIASALAACGDDNATTQPATAPALLRPTPPDYPAEIPTVPSGFTTGEKRPCPEKWQRVSDDVLNYSLCIPPDWGILDYKTGERSTQLARHDEDLKILSPDGFPYPVGVPFEKLFQDPDINLIWIQLAPSSPGADIACDAKPRAPLGSLPAVQCEYRFNYTNDPDPRNDIEYRADGTMVGINVILPLPNQEPDPVAPTIRFGLHIAIVGSEKAMEAYGDTISQILDTVEGQP